MCTPEQFIKERQFLKGVSEKTIQWYRSSFKAFEGALESKAAIIERIASLQKNNSNISINTYLRCVNAYFRWLHEEHGRPLLHISRLKEEQKLLGTFSKDQILRVVKWKPVRSGEARLRVLALTAFDTGMRFDELLGLTRENVDFQNLTLSVKGKGNKHRLIPMSIELRKLLFRHLSSHHHELVFCSTEGGKLTQRNILRDFKIMCRKLDITGVKTSLHCCRHSFSVNYLRSGGNLYYLQRILGHTSITTTEKYLRSLGVADIVKEHSKLSVLTR